MRPLLPWAWPDIGVPSVPAQALPFTCLPWLECGRLEAQQVDCQQTQAWPGVARNRGLDLSRLIAQRRPQAGTRKS